MDISNSYLLQLDRDYWSGMVIGPDSENFILKSTFDSEYIHFLKAYRADSHTLSIGYCMAFECGTRIYSYIFHLQPHYIPGLSTTSRAHANTPLPPTSNHCNSARRFWPGSNGASDLPGYCVLLLVFGTIIIRPLLSSTLSSARDHTP